MRLSLPRLQHRRPAGFRSADGNRVERSRALVNKVFRRIGVSLCGLALVVGSGVVVVRGAAPKKPGAPTLVSPADGSTNVAANPTLAWSASNATSYDVNFGTQNPPAPYWTGWNQGTTFNKTTTTPGTR